MSEHDHDEVIDRELEDEFNEDDLLELDETPIPEDFNLGGESDTDGDFY